MKDRSTPGTSPSTGFLRRLARLLPQPGGFNAPPNGTATLTLEKLRFFPALLSRREILIARLAVLFLLLGLTIVAVRFYQRHIVELPKPGGTYSEALVGSPKFINPVLAFSNDVDLDLSHLLFRGLYDVDSQGMVEHELASHEEVSQDQKTYIITIRRDAFWHDGQPITAHDILFTFDRILDPESQSPYLKTFKGVRVEAIDDSTVRFTLPDPYAPFLSTLTVGLLPAHLWGDIPAANTSLTEYNLKPVGSGPFVFHSLSKDRLGNIKSYRLIRNERFYGPRPYLDELIFRFHPTIEEAVDAIRHKNADGLSFTTKNVRSLLDNDKMNFRQLRLPQYTAVFFNQRNQFFKEKVLRQALERAVSKDAIIQEALGGAGEPIHTPILPGFLGHNPAVQGLAFNPVEARRMLDEAGWKLAEGETVRKKDGKELRFTLTTVDRSEYIRTVEMLHDAWNTIGVGLEIHLFSSNDIIKKVIKPRDYEALLFGEIVGVDPDPYPFWHSSQSFDPGLNLAIFYNKQVDQLLEEARQTHDEEQRRIKYLHFQNILAEEQPAIFLYNPFYIYALPNNVKGFALERISIPSDRFHGVEEWYTNTRKAWR